MINARFYKNTVLRMILATTSMKIPKIRDTQRRMANTINRKHLSRMQAIEFQFIIYGVVTT